MPATYRRVRRPSLLPVSLSLWRYPQAAFTALEVASDYYPGRMHTMQALRGFVPFRGNQKAGGTMASAGVPHCQKKAGISAFTFARAGFPRRMGRFQPQRCDITRARNCEIG